ncbi:MAG: acyl-CoA dehydrogenase family protein, partial [bacterium]
MVSRNRLDCLMGSAGLMRQAVAQAIHHCSYRVAFGKRLVEQPLMQNVLADLAVESEAATVLAFRAARALDRAPADERERSLLRILVTVGKFWVCKRATFHIHEAQECLGGAGYVEESILPRLFRDAPLNSIWEGSGNIQCLDVVRALAREPRAIEALIDELETVRGADARLDAEMERVKGILSDPEAQEYRARHVVEIMATALQAALLVRAGSQAVAEAFGRSRLGVGGGRVYGVLPVGAPVDSIVERASPHALGQASVVFGG